MADLTGGIVLIVRKPDPGPWAAPGLPSGERARRLAGSLLVSSNLDVYEPRCAEAIAAAENDALEKAANELDYRRWETQRAAPDVSEGYRRAAEAVRALKEASS